MAGPIQGVAMLTVKPKVLALITADGSHQDGNGQVYLLGLFSTFNADLFPAAKETMFVYLAVVNGHGPVKLTVRLVATVGEWEKEISTISVNFTDPIEVYEYVFPVLSVIIPAAGEYQLQVVCDGEVLDERRYLARVI